MSLRTVIFDIDGTLADCTHRRHLVDHVNYAATMPTNWPEFKRLASFDPVVRTIRYLLLDLKLCSEIVLCTGRDDSQLGQTVDWLRANHIPYAALYMRKHGDYRPDPVVKRELLVQIRTDGFKPWLVVDDRDSVVAMWREEGLTCLQCAPGNF